jgi:hypothetical protein
MKRLTLTMFFLFVFPGFVLASEKARNTGRYSQDGTYHPPAGSGLTDPATGDYLAPSGGNTFFDISTGEFIQMTPAPPAPKPKRAADPFPAPPAPKAPRAPGLNHDYSSE